LHNAGFNPVPQIVPCIGTFNNQPTCKNPDDVGKALYTDPKAGTVAATNSKVTLFVGGPPAKVQVPSLTGLSPDDAQVQLNNLKLNLDPNYTQVDVDDPNQYGKIQRQDPTANSSVDQGSTVHLTVAKTPNQVTVPNLVGQTFTSAAKTLQNLKLVPSKKDVDSDQPAGTVVGQEPNGGNVAEGKSIELDVSNGSQQKITMPDLTGMTQNGAVAQLQQLGWTGQATITYVRVSDPSQNGVVQATSPSANTQITKSQGVMLQVGASSAGSTSPSTTTTFPSRGGILPPAGGQGVGGN
jgi:beta-lactam-binding protein with PASTA domain